MKSIEKIDIGEKIYFNRKIKNGITITSFELLKSYPNGDPCFVGVHTNEYCLNILFNYVLNLKSISKI